jgi:hypothetical protein
MKDCRPMSTFSTPQIGTHDSGWKLLAERQMSSLGAKRPDGVMSLIPGGLRGYSLGKRRTPW